MSIGLMLVMVFNSPDPIFELNMVINSMIDRHVPSKVIKHNDRAWFNDECVNAFHDKQNAYHILSQIKPHFLLGESCTDVTLSLSMMLHY